MSSLTPEQMEQVEECVDNKVQEAIKSLSGFGVSADPDMVNRLVRLEILLAATIQAVGEALPNFDFRGAIVEKARVIRTSDLRKTDVGVQELLDLMDELDSK